MCGISLIIDMHNQPVARQQMQCMNNKVIHRGPDGEGYYFGENFAMGSRRLSIIDLSDAGLQPMNRGDDWIIFNGMIYNYVELRQELSDLGYKFQSETDTEVLLAACQHWDLQAFNKLNGMWAFAWYKASSDEIILCRDYFGIKPLYYTSVNGLFAAASEIKQFTSLSGFIPVLNKRTTINFLVNGWLNYSEQTFFKDVNELRGGHYLVYNLKNHDCKIHQWYNLSEASAPSNIKLNEAIEGVRHLFGDSMKKRMRADVRIGSCLSGGLDSSAMVSYLHKSNLTVDDFATVTSCYKEKEYDEQQYSDEVSRTTGFQGFKVFPDLNKLLDNGELAAMVYHQDQPFSTASHYSEYSVFKTASINKLTVMLDGQGSDEYLCGYGEFFLLHIKKLLHSGKIIKALRNIRTKTHYPGNSIFKFIKAYFKTVYLYPLIAGSKKALGKGNYQMLSNSWNKLANRHLVEFESKDLRELSLHQMLYSSLPLQLHSEDRNSMMFSIESRLPFLDHRLVEYVISLPADHKIKNGYSKYVLREAVHEMPALIRKRTDKMGFVAPEEPWVRENHIRFKKELTEAIESSDIFSPKLLKRFDRFIKGKLGYEPIYFRAIALHHFIKVFNMQFQNAAQPAHTSAMQKLEEKLVLYFIIPAKVLLSDVGYC
jgi:asparagine synthase (glutamine-hydrolysing)